jgi:hypothetical protein
MHIASRTLRIISAKAVAAKMCHALSRPIYLFIFSCPVRQVSENATSYHTQRSSNACATEQHYDHVECNYWKLQQNALYPTLQVPTAVKFQDSCLLGSSAVQREINILITRYTA